MGKVMEICAAVNIVCAVNIYQKNKFDTMKKNKKKQQKIIFGLIILIIILILIANLLVKQPKLSELQTVACEAADRGGTCDTKLADLGIVLKEGCCQVLGKCCGGV